MSDRDAARHRADLSAAAGGAPGRGGSALEVARAFLVLGLTSFGGPIAHLGYFRREFVERRRWLAEPEFAQLLALCQFLPGPASSQLGFSLGLVRAGVAGGLAAFAAFTLPSALLLAAFAAILPRLGTGAGAAVVHGLQWVAVAVVAHGVIGMARTLCPDLARGTLAVLAASAALAIPGAGVQLVVIAAGALAGLAVLRPPAQPQRALPALGYGPRAGALCLAGFALLLAALPLAARTGFGWLPVADAFYRAGALVFGGGHVVLPLLERAVVEPGWNSRADFLAGYGAAQAVPGPLFSFAAYLGARLPGELGGVGGAAVALAAIFLPGLLLVAGALPLWRALAAHPAAARAVAGVNAAVVGLLTAALITPVWTGAVHGWFDAAAAGAGFALLLLPRFPPLAVVAWCVAASVGRAALAG